MSRVGMSASRVLDKFLIKGKNIVITGGARGLGLNFANGLAQVGANIAAIDIHKKPQEDFDCLQSYGGRCRYYRFGNTSRPGLDRKLMSRNSADVRDYGGLKATIKEIVEEFGTIDGW